jgi:hypothetical protein
LRLTAAPMPVDVMWVLPSVCPDARGVSAGAASAGFYDFGPAELRSRLARPGYSSGPRFHRAS